MFKFKKQFKESWLEKRLVWGAGDKPSDAAPSKPPEKLDAVVDKMDPKKMDQIAERIKTLNLSKMILGDGKVPGDILKLKQALRAKVAEGGDKSLEKTLNVKNLDVVLLDGISENLIKSDKISKASVFDKQKAVDQFLKSNKVGSLAMDNGYWTFFDLSNPPKAVAADYSLDDQDVKEGSGEKVGTAKVDKASASQRVKKLQDKDKADAQQKEVAAKGEAERTKPENLEKVNSDKPVDLKDKMTIEDLTKPLEQATLDAQKNPKITSAEIKSSLLAYIKEANIPGKDPTEQFANFLKLLIDAKYTKASIVNGKIVFEGSGVAPTSNPSNLQKPKEGGGFVARETWAHESLQGSKEAQQKATDKVETDAKVPKKTPMDGVESDVAKILSGKEAPGDKELANVDKRYLPAFQNILSYNPSGAPANFTLPFNDVQMACQFYKAGNGAYIIAWEGGKGDSWTSYNPQDKGPGGLKEAQKYFLNALNSGSTLQSIQAVNIKNKSRFEGRAGFTVDDGPKVLQGGSVKYEFDWATGLGGDPDVTITPLPHGELAVKVEQSDVALDGKKSYEFQAGNFWDMIRTLKTLQKYAEAPADQKDGMKADEADRRFLDRGATGLQGFAGDAGKILSVTSAKPFNLDNKFAESKLDTGYRMSFDWMQKLQPPQDVFIKKFGDRYSLSLQPSNQDLGYVKQPLEQNFNSAMKLIAEQKNIMTTEGGDKLITDRAQKILDDYNNLGGADKGATYGKLEFAAGVKVVAASEGFVYLSRDGMAARKFQFGYVRDGKLVPVTVPSGGIEKAAAEGYLIAKDGALIDKDKGEKKGPPEKPLDTISAKINFPAGSTDRPEVEKPIDAKEKSDALKEVFKDIKPANLELAKQYINGRLLSYKVQGDSANKSKEYVKFCWKALAEYSGVNGVMDDSEKPETQKKIVNTINAKNFPKEVEAKLNTVPGYDKIKDLPSTKAFVKGLVDNLNNVSLFDTNFADQPELFAKAKQAYLDGLGKIITDMFAAKDWAKKPGEQNLSYDKRIRQGIWNNVRLPENFMKDYRANEDKRVALDKYNADQKTIDEAQKNYDLLKGSPNLMSFEDFSKQTMGGVVPDAFKLMQNTKGLDLKDAYLSRIPGNGPVGETVSFNVKSGPVGGDQVPVTITFSKQAGQLRISGANGWNNVTPEVSKFVSGSIDAVKEVSDDIRVLGTNERMSLPTGADVKPVDQPKTAPDVGKDKLDDAATRKALGDLLDDPAFGQNTKEFQNKIASILDKGDVNALKLPSGYATKEAYVKDLKDGKVTAQTITDWYVGNEIIPKSSKMIEKLAASTDLKSGKTAIIDVINTTHGFADKDVEVKIAETMDKFKILDFKLPSSYKTVEQFKLDLKAGKVLTPVLRDFAASNKVA